MNPFSCIVGLLCIESGIEITELCLEFSGYVSFTSHRIFKAATKHINEDLKELEYSKIHLYKLTLLHETLINVPSSKSQSLSFRSGY